MVHGVEFGVVHPGAQGTRLGGFGAAVGSAMRRLADWSGTGPHVPLPCGSALGEGEFGAESDKGDGEGAAQALDNPRPVEQPGAD